MKSTRCNTAGSSIYRQLSQVQLSEQDRQRARYALRDAEAVVNAVLWAKERIESAAALFLKPGYRH